VNKSRIRSISLLFLLLSINGCKNKGESKEIEKPAISSSIDSLRAYVELPAIETVRWIYRPMGEQSAFSIGPQDFELLVYSPSVPALTRQYIEKNLAPNETDSESVTIDSLTAKLLGMDTSSLETEGELYIVNGTVYNARPLIRHLTSGVIILTDSILLVIAGTS